MGKKYQIWNTIVNGFKSDFDDLAKLKKEVNAHHQVRDIQIGILAYNFELFTYKKGEKIREMSGHFNSLINALKNINKIYSS